MGTIQELVGIALEHHPELAGMEVIVEKELLHYELLHVLDRGGWLDALTFQGGTALRLCYGGSRFSEDLDFSGGPGFSTNRMGDLANELKDSLSGMDLSVDVISPNSTISQYSSEIGVSSWRIVFEFSSVGRAVRKQKIKLDIDNAPRYTEDSGAIAQNYDVVRESRMLVRVQSQEEILASKFVAFSTSVVTRNRPRYRDIWDMHWLTGKGIAIRDDLVRAKMSDYRVESAGLEATADRVADIVRSADFSKEMRRFLPPHLVAQSLDKPMFIEHLAGEAERLIRRACHSFKCKCSVWVES